MLNSLKKNTYLQKMNPQNSKRVGKKNFKLVLNKLKKVIFNNKFRENYPKILEDLRKIVILQTLGK